MDQKDSSKDRRAAFSSSSTAQSNAMKNKTTGAGSSPAKPAMDMKINIGVVNKNTNMSNLNTPA